MKAFVITILDNPRSVEYAQRCIASGAKYGLHIEMFCATTPKDDIYGICKAEGIDPKTFEGVYSRIDNVISCFLSHYFLWKSCVDEDFLIFEHDAIVTDPIPNVTHKGCISFGKPSYGKFNTPPQLGVNRLTSKPYFPGAHAYQISARGAKLLVNNAPVFSKPTDVYLNLDVFTWLEEYYPWCAEVRDSFTTIQNIRGCQAKHNFGESYEIIEA